MKIINTKNAPAAIGPYSQAISIGRQGQPGYMLFTSGQLGIEPGSGKLAQGIEAQCRLAIENLGAILSAAGLGFSNVVKTTCYLKNMSDFSVFNKIYTEFFTGLPARSCVEVAALPLGALVEIEAVAAEG